MGRDIEAIKISGEDRRKYRDKLRRSLDVFDRMLRERMFEADPSQVGQEIELNLVDSDGDAVDAQRGRARRDRGPGLGDRARAVQHRDQRAAPARWRGDALADLEQEVRASLNAADSQGPRAPAAAWS